MTDAAVPTSVTLRRSPRNTVRLASVCAATAVAGGISALAARSAVDGPLLACALAVLLAGAGTALLATCYFVFRLASSSPLLIIDHDGVTDRSSLVGVGLIRWNEIVSVEPIDVNGQSFISIRTRQPQAVIDRQRFRLKRWALQFSEKRGWGAATITANVLPMPRDEVVTLLRSHLEVHNRS